MGKHSDSNFNVHKQRSNNILKVSRKSNKRKTRRTNNTIKKLFDQLRNESDSVSSHSSTSVTDNTVIELPPGNCKENNTSMIIIRDDDDIRNNETCSNLPLYSSTPIPSKSRIVLQESKDTPCKATSNLSSEFNDDVINLTREIDMDSYLTIDLTTDSANKTNDPKVDTVIDLVNTSEDCTLKNSSSMSGDSDVTVINTAKRKRKIKNNIQMKKFAGTIAKLDSIEKDKLLELIAEKIFNGCKTPANRSLHSLKNGINQSTETVEDTYIKEVILGQKISRNSIGSNIYNPGKDIKNRKGLRMIVIDGSNVAMQHTKGKTFSVKGLQICINYFLEKNHVVKAFVPRFRCKYGKSTNGKLLDQLEREGHVVYTPSREVQGRIITSYDDRYIVQCAAEFDGVIVSGDYYRDLLDENPRWRFIIENRLLQFTWVGDMIMFPKDPLGRHGPTLQEFLRHPE